MNMLRCLDDVFLVEVKICKHAPSPERVLLEAVPLEGSEIHVKGAPAMQIVRIYWQRLKAVRQ